MSARGAHGQTLRSGCYPNPWPRDLLRGGHGNRALDRQGDALDVGDELRVERDVQAVSTGSSCGILDGLDHDAEHRESRALNVGRLGTDQGRHSLDGLSSVPPRQRQGLLQGLSQGLLFKIAISA